LQKKKKATEVFVFFFFKERTSLWWDDFQGKKTSVAFLLHQNKANLGTLPLANKKKEKTKTKRCGHGCCQ
jgi:hypothetical protein